MHFTLALGLSLVLPCLGMPSHGRVLSRQLAENDGQFICNSTQLSILSTLRKSANAKMQLAVTNQGRVKEWDQ